MQSWGNPLTLDGLARGFDAILLAVGELSKEEAEKLGLAVVGSVLRADPNTCQTPLEKVLQQEVAMRPQKQIIKAMAEGRAAAECGSLSARATGGDRRSRFPASWGGLIQRNSRRLSGIRRVQGVFHRVTGARAFATGGGGRIVAVLAL